MDLRRYVSVFSVGSGEPSSAHWLRHPDERHPVLRPAVYHRGQRASPPSGRRGHHAFYAIPAGALFSMVMTLRPATQDSWAKSSAIGTPSRFTHPKRDHPRDGGWGLYSPPSKFYEPLGHWGDWAKSGPYCHDEHTIILDVGYLSVYSFWSLPQDVKWSARVDAGRRDNSWTADASPVSSD